MEETAATLLARREPYATDTAFLAPEELSHKVAHLAMRMPDPSEQEGAAAGLRMEGVQRVALAEAAVGTAVVEDSLLPEVAGQVTPSPVLCQLQAFQQVMAQGRQPSSGL